MRHIEENVCSHAEELMGVVMAIGNSQQFLQTRVNVCKVFYYNFLSSSLNLLLVAFKQLYAIRVYDFKL